LNLALANPNHVGVTRGILIFIKLGLLTQICWGDYKDLASSQKGSTSWWNIRRWIGIYRAYLSGKSNKYAEIVNQRLDLMEIERYSSFLATDRIW